ncbi:hypothetical protein E4U58_006172 [Claviceps cyperi]|nr:hypothetical protein E4U58_006172 [Claviceps cyperi]
MIRVRSLLLSWCFLGCCQAQKGYSSLATRSSSTPPAYHFDVSEYLSHLPACGASCVNASITAGWCADPASCICSDQVFSNEVNQCVKSSCPHDQQSITRNMTEAACGRPPRDKSNQYNATSIALCTITGILVFARLIFKQWFSSQRKLNLDDWLLFASVSVGLPCTILNITGLTANGLGKDVWNVSQSNLVNFARFFFIQQILYLYLMTTIKSSLIHFYLTIFPTKRVRIVLWSTFGVNIAWGIACILVTIFQCVPVENNWLRYLQQDSSGKCLNMNLLGWTNGAVSVAIDLWIIGIPLSQITKLDLHWKKKIGAIVMFLTGTFVTIVSILRLQSLLYFFSSSNPTWDLWYTAWWSTIEINIGLICACLPAVRLLLARMWPRMFGNTSRSKSWVSGSQPMMARQDQLRIESLVDLGPQNVPSPKKERHMDSTSPTVHKPLPKEPSEPSNGMAGKSWNNNSRGAYDGREKILPPLPLPKPLPVPPKDRSL